MNQQPMQPNLCASCSKRSRREGAFSLIEMIGVITVLALLALALTPMLIKQFDRIAGDKEVARLKAFADAYKQGIRNGHPKYIPNEVTWTNFIAANAGVQSDQVLNNERRVPRVFLIHPNFQVGDNPNMLHPPYTNSLNGASTVAQPQLMIVSSISAPFTNLSMGGVQLVSGANLSVPNFNNIWSAREGTLPTGWPAAWKGKPDDLKIQRINLSDFFISVTLNTDLYTSPGKYSIDESAVANVPAQVNPGDTNSWLPWTAYFVDGTVISLYDTGGVLQYREVLHRSKSFTYSLGSWQGERFLGRTISRPGPFELDRASILFTNSALHPCNGITPVQVYNAMYAYMYNYYWWCFTDCQWANNHPSGAYGDILAGDKNTLGSEAYLNDKTAGLICPPSGGP